ncbi:MAG: hypothetical protein JXR39_08965 [Marinilabiliaceae bacterium]|nr:hypothetical protein [Marinilabiliaceae bacterium]
MSVKQSKIVKLIADIICHDPFAYNPKWKWKDLPENVRSDYHRILPILKLWEKNGYITLLEDGEYAFILHPEKLPNKIDLLNMLE